MLLRNAGILRKIPDDTDLHLTIDGSVLTVKVDEVPRILSGTPGTVFDRSRNRIGKIYRGFRNHKPDLIEIRVFNLEYSISFTSFRNVWNDVYPYCSIFERVKDCWKDFEGVTV